MIISLHKIVGKQSLAKNTYLKLFHAGHSCACFTRDETLYFFTANERAVCKCLQVQRFNVKIKQIKNNIRGE